MTPRRNRQGWALSLGLLTLLGAALRSRGIAGRDFWLDESNTFLALRWLYDRGPEAPLFVQATNLLYYVVLHAWAGLFGDSEQALRGLSVLLSSLCIPVIGLFGRELAGKRVGLAAAALAALHALHVYYAQEARAYAAWTLALSVASWLALRAVRSQRLTAWLAYALALLVAFGCHVLTVFWVPASAAFVLLAEDRARALRGWLLSTSGVALVAGPFFVWVCWPVLREGVGAWAAGFWMPWLSLPLSLWALLPAGTYPGYLAGLSLASENTSSALPAPLALGAALLALAVGFVALGALAAAAFSRSAARESHVAQLLLVLCFAPLVLQWLYSWLFAPSYIVGRYDLIAWPAVVVGLAFALERFAQSVAPRAAGPALIAAVVVLGLCAAFPIARYTSHSLRGSFAYKRAERIAVQVAPGDLVLSFGNDADGMAYALHRRGFDAPLVRFPSWQARRLGWVDLARDTHPSGLEAAREDAREMAARVRSTIESGRRAYVLEHSLALRRAQGAPPTPQMRLDALLYAELERAGLQPKAADTSLGLREVSLR